jgi:hypothetical protein
MTKIVLFLHIDTDSTRTRTMIKKFEGRKVKDEKL